MGTRESLREAIAGFFEVDPSQVGPTFPISGPLLSGSLGRATLDSRIRRQVGLKLSGVYSARTYGELEAEITRDGSDQPTQAPGTPAKGAHNGLAKIASRPTGRSLPEAGNQVLCGIDIELIDSFPAATDCWEEGFYKDNFTPAEIAYCLMQERPAEHFAGRWCAKEALKKCDPDFLSEEMKNLELVAGGSQQPVLNHYIDQKPYRLPLAVSIAHTPVAAIAVVVKIGNVSTPTEVPATQVAAASEGSPTPIQPQPRGDNKRSRLSILGTLLAFAAACLSVLSLLKSYNLIK